MIARESIFARLTTGDLCDTARMLDWWEVASSRTRPVVGSSECDRLNVLGAAERALDVAANPPAVFASLVSRGNWNFITADQAERARLRLLDWFRTKRPPPSPFLQQMRQRALKRAEHVPEWEIRNSRGHAKP